MFSSQCPMIKIRSRLPLGLILFLALSSCTPPRVPIELTDVSSTHQPIVGKFVDMQVEVRSIGDEPNVVLALSLHPANYSTDDEHRWELNLKEKDPITVLTEICILEAGTWAIDMSTVALWDDGEYKYGELATIIVISTADTREVLLEREFTFSHQQQTQDAPGTDF